MINVRPARPDTFDKQAVAYLLLEYYRADPDPEAPKKTALEVFDEAVGYLKDRDAGVFIAETGEGVPVGLIVLRDNRDGSVTAGALYSRDREHTRTPLELMRAGAAWARAKEAQTVRIACTERNAARSLYARLGFETVLWVKTASLDAIENRLGENANG
jgi:hypothetical protein